MWFTANLERLCWLFLAFCGGVWLVLGQKAPHPQILIPPVPVSSVSPTTTAVALNQAVWKPQTPAIDNFYYQSIKPILSEKYENMEIYQLYLGENTGMKEALGWLQYHFPHKKFQSNFSYALYNATEQEQLIAFDFRLQNPPPHFLLAYFVGGQRTGQTDIDTLETLKKLGQGATKLYLFWNQPPPYLTNAAPFNPQNYHLEIVYERGTNFGGPSYLAIDKIILKDIQQDQIIAIYPINQKIEEPFVIFNYDFELKFPFYNYTSEGVLWSTNHIKSLKKIDLYEKRTGQHRTLYYDT